MACDGRSSKDAHEMDIFLFDVSTGTETPLVQHPADDSVVGWAPDGRSLLFISDRRREKDVWALPIDAGQPKSEPRLVKAGIGDVTPFGISTDGALFYGVASGGMGLYQVAVDFSAGKVLSPAKEIPRPPTGNVLKMALSHDGRSIAYCVPEGRGFTRPKLLLIDLETKKHRNLYASISDRRLDTPIWSKDGQTLFLRSETGGAEGRQVELNLIDVASGTVTPLGSEKVGNRVAWTAAFNERSVAYVWYNPTKQSFVAVVRDLTTGRQTEAVLAIDKTFAGSRKFALSSDLTAVYDALNPTKPSPERPAIAYRHDLSTGDKREFMRWTNSIELFASPDGSSVIAAGATEGNGRVFKSFSVQGKQLVEQWSIVGSRISNAPKPAQLIASWAPDGSQFLFRTEFIETAGEKLQLKTELWAITAKTGESRKTDLPVSWVSGNVNMHPDGKQIFFVGGDEGVNEVWVMENFLPPVATTK